MGAGARGERAGLWRAAALFVLVCGATVHLGQEGVVRCQDGCDTRCTTDKECKDISASTPYCNNTICSSVPETCPGIGESCWTPEGKPGAYHCDAAKDNQRVCGGTCGNGFCQGFETHNNCPDDCLVGSQGNDVGAGAAGTACGQNFIGSACQFQYGSQTLTGVLKCVDNMARCSVQGQYCLIAGSSWMSGKRSVDGECISDRCGDGVCDPSWYESPFNCSADCNPDKKCGVGQYLNPFGNCVVGDNCPPGKRKVIDSSGVGRCVPKNSSERSDPETLSSLYCKMGAETWEYDEASRRCYKPCDFDGVCGNQENPTMCGDCSDDNNGQCRFDGYCDETYENISNCPLDCYYDEACFSDDGYEGLKSSGRNALMTPEQWEEANEKINAIATQSPRPIYGKDYVCNTFAIAFLRPPT